MFDFVSIYTGLDFVAAQGEDFERALTATGMIEIHFIIVLVINIMCRCANILITIIIIFDTELCAFAIYISTMIYFLSFAVLNRVVFH